MAWTHWSEQEMLRLRELYPTTELPEIALQLNRPLLGVRMMLRKLKLKKQPAAEPWTPETREILRILYPTMGSDELAPMLHRPAGAIRSMANRMGLKLANRPGVLPLGTERAIHGRMFRKVSMHRGRLENWQPVDRLEQSPELRELYRLLAQVETAARDLAKTPAP